MEIRAVVADDGDGWLQINVNEWIQDKLGEADEDLTEDLFEWADGRNLKLFDGILRTVTDWADERYAEVTGPGCDDDRPVSFYSGNEDHLLNEDIGIVLLRAGEASSRDFDLLAVLDGGDVHVLHPATEWVDPVDWGRAYGECPNGHRYTVEQACYLQPDQGRGSHRLTECCRLGPDDKPYESGYVACPHPDCGKPVTFTA